MSHNSVREALTGLQAVGIVEIRHGSGTYVGAMSVAPMIEGLTFRTVAVHHRGEDSLLKLLELREAVEAAVRDHFGDIRARLRSTRPTQPTQLDDNSVTPKEKNDPHQG